jgi:hypothetical protein
MAIFMVLWTTTVQRGIPTHVLSRVGAYDWFGSLVFAPIGMALAGPVNSRNEFRRLSLDVALMILLIVATLPVPSVVRLTASTNEEETGDLASRYEPVWGAARVG